MAERRREEVELILCAQLGSVFGMCRPGLLPVLFRGVLVPMAH